MILVLSVFRYPNYNDFHQRGVADMAGVAAPAVQHAQLRGLQHLRGLCLASALFLAALKG